MWDKLNSQLHGHILVHKSSLTNARETTPKEILSANSRPRLTLFKEAICSKWDQWKLHVFYSVMYTETFHQQFSIWRGTFQEDRQHPRKKKKRKTPRESSTPACYRGVSHGTLQSSNKSPRVILDCVWLLISGRMCWTTSLSGCSASSQVCGCRRAAQAGKLRSVQEKHPLVFPCLLSRALSPQKEAVLHMY